MVLRLQHILELEGDKAWGSSRPYSWLFIFQMYISELPTLLNRNTKILFYAFDTARTVNSPNPYNYQIIMEEMCYINKWFKANLLSLNLEKELIGYNLVQ